MKTTHLFQSASYALVAATTAVSLLLMAYFVAEPAISRAQAADTAEFTIAQTITDESSFLVAPADVIMDGSLNGLSGGTANGSTTFSVQSNNSSGYTVEISFFNNGTEGAMLGAETASQAIRDFQDGIAAPDFDFTASTAAQFGYTVESVTPGDTAAAFLDDAGDLCNNGGSEQTADACWMSPTTSAFTIVSRDVAAPEGASSTIKFRVVVPSNPVPVPVAETYYATATLSLFNN